MVLALLGPLEKQQADSVKCLWGNAGTGAIAQNVINFGVSTLLEAKSSTAGDTSGNPANKLKIVSLTRS